MKINLHIEKLILYGYNLPPNQMTSLRTQLITELSQLLSTGDISTQLTDGFTAKTMSTTNRPLNPANASVLGQHIAQSVYGAINHE